MVEPLEKRLQLSTNMLTFHNDGLSDGVNNTETTLSPANVKVGSFGKTATVPVDGNVYAEPLVYSSDTITAGPNTLAGATGVHDVVFVATENDSVYAVDMHSGAVLWQRSFLNIGAGAGLTAGTDINNPLTATAIVAPNDNDIQSQDINPIFGITGTPVIDPGTGIMYLVAFTKETVNGVTNLVQRLHAISINNGTDVGTPFMIGNTTGANTNNTPIYVYGNGDGSVTDPYNNTGKQVVQFNALRENQRSGLALENNTIYVCWASHSDDNPYHGWVAAFNISNVTTTGITLQGVFCSSPNGGQAGVWMGGGKPSFETSGNTFYVETGNGDATGATVVNAAGFPANGDYYEAVIKITVDSTTSPTNQNINGWGLKASDYFIPSNQPALDNADQDLGSGAPQILPASAGIPGHPDLMLAAGKQGVVYVIDRDNMGKFNPNHDDVVNAYDVGIATPPVAVTGVLSSPVYFNGTIYYVSGYSGPAEALTLNSDGTLTETSQSAQSSFGYLPGSPVISANGTTGGILWVSDRSSNELHAYDANSLSTELWNSSQKANNADAPGSLDKMNAPTVADGEVFLGTSNSLDIYGLTPPGTKVPNAPVLSSSAISATSINLRWTDSTTAPNTATSYSVEELINGTWTAVTTAPGGYTSVAVGGLALQTTYQFRIRGLNGIGYSAYSNTTTVTTSNLAASINFAYGFAGSTTQLTYNGSAKINSTTAELTDGGSLEASSVFSNTPVDVTKFSTTFHFQLTAGTTADGFTFCIQSNSPTALGGPGGGLGYAGDGVLADPIITNSIAIKFDLYDNAGEGINSTGLFQNGANPTVPAIDLTPSGINLHSGDLFVATVTYNGAFLTETVTDTQTGAIFTQNYTVNIPADTGNTAYVGFTAGTGGVPTIENVLDWTFSPNAPAAPAAPSGLGAVVASATSINLTWTNNATNQTGYSLDRATDALFTQNLVTQTLPATPNSFTDTYTGLASGGTYYYRIRAVNTAGSSVSSNAASISIPFAPAKATNGNIESVTTNSISLSWTDNAGTTATGYNILRAVNHGTFVLYTTLPNLNVSPPSEYDWTDTGLTPGVFYDYHIQCFNIAGYNDFTGGNATTLTAAPTGLTGSANSSGISLSWNAPAGAVAYNVYRGTTAGGESATPIATGITAPSYFDSAVGSSVTYYYYVTALNGNLSPINAESAASNEFSVTSTAAANVVKLTGTAIGAGGSFSAGSTYAAAFDGSYSTFFDPANGTLTNWVGLDLGSPQTITQIKYAPRSGWEFRMYGGQFQASNTADFSSGVVTLYTVTAIPVAGQFTTASVNPTGTYRYVRYTGGTQWVNIAEMEVDGIASSAPTTVKLTGAAIGVGGNYSPGSTYAAAFDGSFSTYFDPANGTLGDWVGLDLSGPQTITQIKYAPRSGYEYRMVGGQFQVSNSANFSSGVVTLYTIASIPVAGQFTTINVSPGGAYRYVRYIGGTQWVNIAELEVDGVLTTPPPTAGKLTGTAIGVGGAFSSGSGYAAAFDGSFSTYFDPADGGLTDWVGLDIGAADTITQIQYAPRAGYEYRMFGGEFQVSNSANFSTGVVTIYTVNAIPTAGQFTTVQVSVPGTYRYIRYTGGNQWVNIAEMEVDGMSM